jgi:hypothetical protein
MQGVEELVTSRQMPAMDREPQFSTDLGRQFSDLANSLFPTILAADPGQPPELLDETKLQVAISDNRDFLMRWVEKTPVKDVRGSFYQDAVNIILNLRNQLMEQAVFAKAKGMDAITKQRLTVVETFDGVLQEFADTTHKKIEDNCRPDVEGYEHDIKKFLDSLEQTHITNQEDLDTLGTQLATHRDFLVGRAQAFEKRWAISLDRRQEYCQKIEKYFNNFVSQCKEKLLPQ